MRFRYCLCILCAALAAAFAFLLLLQSQPAIAQAPAAKPVSFINDVGPIFKDYCFGCHCPKGAGKAGKLDMTTYDALRKGGTNADPIVPGQPEESNLVMRLKHTGAKRMPPKTSGETKQELAALPADKIQVVEQWIKQGAKLDAGIQAKADLLRELRIRWKPPAPPAAYKFPVIVNSLAFTPDNQKLVVSGHHELTVWDIANAKLEKRIHTRAERAYAMRFLPDGKFVVAGGRPGQEGDVKIYDINAKPAKMEDGVAILDGVNDKAVMLGQLIDADDAVLCLALTPDGKFLAAGGCDRLVRVWDISAGITAAKLVTNPPIENHADWVLGVALSPDGHFLWTASRDKTVKVWDLLAKESVITYADHQQPVYGVVVQQKSPTDAVGYSGGDDKNVRSWNFKIAVTKDKEGKEIRQPEGKQRAAMGGHSGAVLKVALHPTKPILVSCGADNNVMLWNADNGARGRALAGLTDQVFAVAISPDANLVAAGSYNGEVRIWKVADGALVKNFNASPGLPTAAAPPKK
jgi:WD40 repeat protein